MTQQYPGMVPRQGLVDYCQQRAKALSLELKREQDLLDRKADTMSDDQYETLVISTTSIMGTINGFREITEWAREEVEKERKNYG